VDRQLILQEFKKNKFQIPDHFIEDRVNTITREELMKRAKERNGN
jgi:hypothetical protein